MLIFLLPGLPFNLAEVKLVQPSKLSLFPLGTHKVEHRCVFCLYSRWSNINGCVQMAEDMKCSLGRQLQSQQSRPGVCGLDNSGNSCYLNAVLQCLCSTMPLVEHLLNQDTRKDLGRYAAPCLSSLSYSSRSTDWTSLFRCKCRLAQVFVQLLEKMWLGSSSSCAPVETRSMLGSIFPQFDNYTQQDAQELLLHLLNGLHEDLKKVPQNHSSTKTVC